MINPLWANGKVVRFRSGSYVGSNPTRGTNLGLRNEIDKMGLWCTWCGTIV